MKGGDVKERPILFNGDMVRAYLGGLKGQTRRVIKKRVKDGGQWWTSEPTSFATEAMIREAYRCPYGKPGDRLWVRETFHCYNDWQYFYRADGDCNKNLQVKAWTPSIFMRRTASRFLLDVTEVGVERVQDISEEDAQAEGVQIPVSEDGHWLQALTGGYIPKEPTFREHFIRLWDSINKKRGFGWDVNPWVWVVKFPKHEKEAA